MSRLGPWLLLALFAVCWARASGEPTPEQGKGEEVSAYFHDGTVVRKVTIQDSIELLTKYGKLTVPVRDIRRIDFGLHLSAETARQIEEAVRQLGSEKFTERQAASKQLV